MVTNNKYLVVIKTMIWYGLQQKNPTWQNFLNSLFYFQETSRKQMLAIGSSRTLLTIHHQRIGKHNTDVLPTVAKDIGAIAYNSLKNALFVNDLAIKMIFQYDLVNELMMPLNISVAGNIGAMDFGE